MTKEEAIRWLNDRKAKYLELTRQYPSSSQLMLTTQIIDMAIDALSSDDWQVASKLKNPCDSFLTEESNGSKEHKSKLDLISRSDAIDAVCGDCSIETKNNCKEEGYCYEVRNLKALPSAEAEWVPCSERLPSEEDCPMDCMVTRRSKFIGNYVDMAVAEKNGTWTHEDWDAIVLGDVESGRKTGLINTHDHPILAWMPLPKPYREDGGV